jgi:hypothetical protein
MAYRDDNEAMKQRIVQLEGELAAAQDAIGRLKGYVDERASDDMADVLTKEQIHVVRELDVELDDAALEAIADMLRQRLAGSTVSMVGSKLHCKWQTSTLEVVRHQGRTEIRIAAHDPRHKLLLGLGGMGFAVLAGPLLSAPLVALGVPPLAWLGLVPLFLFAGYRVMDYLTRHTLRRNRQNLTGAFEAALALAEERGTKAQQRIAVEGGVATEAEAEALAEEEAEAAEAEELKA